MGQNSKHNTATEERQIFEISLNWHLHEMSLNSGKVKYEKHSCGPALITIDYTGPLSLSGNRYSLSHVSAGVKATSADVFIKPH